MDDVRMHIEQAQSNLADFKHSVHGVLSDEVLKEIEFAEEQLEMALGALAESETEEV